MTKQNNIKILNNQEIFDICFDVLYLKSVDKENYKQALKLIDTFVPYGDGELLHEAQSLCKDIVVWGDVAKVKFQKLFKKSDKRYTQAVYLDEKIRKSNSTLLKVISYIEEVLGIPYDEFVCSRCKQHLIEIVTKNLSKGRRMNECDKESFKVCRKALVDLLKEIDVKITKDTHPKDITLSTEEVNAILRVFNENYSKIYGKLCAEWDKEIAESDNK